METKTEEEILVRLSPVQVQTVHNLIKYRLKELRGRFSNPKESNDSRKKYLQEMDDMFAITVRLGGER